MLALKVQVIEKSNADWHIMVLNEVLNSIYKSINQSRGVTKEEW